MVVATSGFKKDDIKRDSGITNQPTAFLIEGFQSCNDVNRFPDIAAAIQVATSNNCAYFDSISSFDSEHIAEQLRNKSEREQKAIILSVYLTFMSEISTKNIVEHLLKRPYQDLVSAGIFREIPSWLNNLSAFTINDFAQSVLNEMFDGSREAFKKYNAGLQGESDRISDQISTRRFLDYISRNPSVTTVYGLIGRNHLDMLNSVGSVAERGESYRLIRVSVSGRTVDVHLFGGTHGNMDHYQQLATHVQRDGLIVPPPPEKKVNQELENLLKMLLISPARPREDLFEGHRDRLTKDEPKKTTTELAKQFDYWMKTYDHPGGKTHNQELVAWLTADGGGRYVRDYKSFCELAKVLSGAEFKYSTQPPPDESDYKKSAGVDERSGRPWGVLFEDHGDKKPKDEPKKTTTELAEQFDYWMKTYHHPGGKTHNQELVTWLAVDDGGRYVRDYKMFCELAKALSAAGYMYSTQPPPDKSSYQEAMKKYEKRVSQNQRRSGF
jgi:hypothetical protein